MVIRILIIIVVIIVIRAIITIRVYNKVVRRRRITV